MRRRLSPPARRSRRSGSCRPTLAAGLRREGQGTPCPFARSPPDAPAVQLHQATGQGQPQPRALAEVFRGPACRRPRRSAPGPPLRSPRRYPDGHPTPSRPLAGATTTRRPVGVNFTAFDSRLSTTCLTLRSSASIFAHLRADHQLQAPPCVARSADQHQPALQHRRTGGSGEGSSPSARPPPCSNVEMSLIRLEQVPPGGRECRSIVLLFVAEVPNIASSMTSEKPLMAFSGVLSSWDMVARNSDLAGWRPPAAAPCLPAP